MFLTIEEKVIPISRLYTVTAYAKKKKLSYNGVLWRLKEGNEEAVEICGILFIIDKEGEE